MQNSNQAVVDVSEDTKTISFDKDDKAPEVVTQESIPQRQPTKLEIKRAKQYLERRQRLKNRGVPEDKIDAAIAAEDWQNLPIEEKFKRTIVAINQSFQRFAQDIMQVRHNQNVLADTMDENFRGFAKMLTKLGVPPEEQKKMMEEASAEMAAERTAQMEAQIALAKAKEAKSEKQTVESELQKAEAPLTATNVDANGSPTPPEDATSFGG